MDFLLVRKVFDMSERVIWIHIMTDLGTTLGEALLAADQNLCESIKEH